MQSFTSPLLASAFVLVNTVTTFPLVLSREVFCLNPYIFMHIAHKPAVKQFISAAPHI